MSEITKRIGHGRPLTWGELDGNFDAVEQLRTEAAQAVAESSANATSAAGSAENALTAQNEAVAAAEQVEADVTRTLKAPAGEVLGDLPSAVNRQDTLLGFGANGLPMVKPVSDFVQYDDSGNVPLPADLRANTRELWRRSLAEIGLTLVSGSVQVGAVVQNSTEAVWDIEGAQCYTYTDDDFPQEANEATVPGVGWVSVGGESLRSQMVGNNVQILKTHLNIPGLVSDVTLKPGRMIQIIDRDYAKFTVATAGSGNGYDSIALNNGLFAELIIANGTYKAVHFGAKIGGSIDSTGAVQATINKDPSGGGVELPSGFLLVTDEITVPKEARQKRIYSTGTTTFLCRHNGNGLVIESNNENFGRNSIENIELRGPNSYYPAAGYIPPSNGVGLKLLNTFDNIFKSVRAFGFNKGHTMDGGFNNQFDSGCEFQFNQFGIGLENARFATNINIYRGVKVRENRVKGIYFDGTKGIYPLTQNQFIGCYIESNSPWEDGYIDIPEGDYSRSVAVDMNRAYEGIFENCYFENHATDFLIRNQSSNNKFPDCRHDYSANRKRKGKIVIQGQYCLNNNFDGQIYSTTAADIGDSLLLSDNATQTGSVSNCIGISLKQSDILGEFDVFNNKPFGFSGGTPTGVLGFSKQGYRSNPNEGTTPGTITGIGTATATLNCQGLSEISIETLMTAATTITSISGLTRRQLLFIWNGQSDFPVTIKATPANAGLIQMISGDCVLKSYGDYISFFVNSRGQCMEISRRIKP